MLGLYFFLKKMQKDGKPFIKMHTIFSLLLAQSAI